MKLIPVIDLMNARVVTAKCGKRQAYMPSDTPLCRSSRPQEVLSALLDLHAFDTVYFADLDAIVGNGSNLDLMNALCHDHPEITFWVDNGLTELDRLCGFARPIIGTESLSGGEQFSHLHASLASPILSLDYIDGRFKGPSGLDRMAELWPQDVIAMTLSRVGAATGPDLKLLQQLSSQRSDLRLYAAGGIRNLRDLERLRAIGADGVLLSTALHQGTIDGATIGRFFNT
jgi:phosphoribosylformimino-5-aminoimidazole carboxamide ribotide isomerase